MEMPIMPWLTPLAFIAALIFIALFGVAILATEIFNMIRRIFK